jgi:hypothetical protein
MIQPNGVASRKRVWRNVWFKDGKGSAQGLFNGPGIPVGNKALGKEVSVGDFALVINGILYAVDEDW